MSALDDYEAREERSEREAEAYMRELTEQKALQAVQAQALVPAQAPVPAQAERDEALLKKVLHQTRRVPAGMAFLPTELTRAGLIRSPANSNDRPELVKQELALGRGIQSLVYTGPELGPKEETAWLAVLMLARTQMLGTRIHFKIAELLKICGLNDSADNFVAMRMRLSRLSQAHFSIDYTRKVAGKPRKFHVETHLLGFEIEHETGDTVVWLDPAGVQLYSNLSYQPWDVRLGLATGISQQLLTYVSGHTPDKQQTIKVEELQALFGYNGPTSRFVRACKSALKELEVGGIIVEGTSKVATARDPDTRQPIQRFSWRRTAKKQSDIECGLDLGVEFDAGVVAAESWGDI